MYVSKKTDYKTFLKRNVTSILATKTYCNKPFVGTILYYAKGNSCNQKVFQHGYSGARGFQFQAKKKEKGKDHTKSPKFLGTKGLV